MSRSAGGATHDDPASDPARRSGLPLSTADRRQAELFAALLADHRRQLGEDINSTTAAVAQYRHIGDTLTSRRLRQSLQHLSRRRDELDLLCAQVQLRLADRPHERTEATRQFDIVVTRRRVGWRLQIPRFNVALANIDSRAEAEAIGRSLIAAVTGIPVADIEVRALVG